MVVVVVALVVAFLARIGVLILVYFIVVCAMATEIGMEARETGCHLANHESTHLVSAFPESTAIGSPEQPDSWARDDTHTHTHTCILATTRHHCRQPGRDSKRAT